MLGGGAVVYLVCQEGGDVRHKLLQLGIGIAEGHQHLPREPRQRWSTARRWAGAWMGRLQVRCWTGQGKQGLGWAKTNVHEWGGANGH